MNVEKEGVLCNKEYNPASESQLYVVQLYVVQVSLLGNDP